MEVHAIIPDPISHHSSAHLFRNVIASTACVSLSLSTSFLHPPFSSDPKPNCLPSIFFPRIIDQYEIVEIRSIHRLHAIIHRQALAGCRPIQRALYEFGQHGDHLVDGSDQLFCRIAFAVTTWLSDAADEATGATRLRTGVSSSCSGRLCKQCQAASRS